MKQDNNTKYKYITQYIQHYIITFLLFFFFFGEIITTCCYLRSSNSFSPRPPSTSYMGRYQFSYKVFSNTILLHIYNLSYKLNRTMFTYNIIIYYKQIHKHQFTFRHFFEVLYNTQKATFFFPTHSSSSFTISFLLYIYIYIYI